jgi:hypothetical protein
MPADYPSRQAIDEAARYLGVAAAAIAAIAEVEAGPEGAFLPSGEPTQLFERHVFHRLTAGRFARVAPDLSDPTPGGYGLVRDQPARVERAAKLDRTAAWKATSWGLYQILGRNYALAGFPSVEAMVAAMRTNVGAHLAALVAFIRSTPTLASSLRRLDWPAFARYYNGKGYARNQYDTKLADAYRRHKP